jgi:hypothetical protein
MRLREIAAILTAEANRLATVLVRTGAAGQTVSDAATRDQADATARENAFVASPAAEAPPVQLPRVQFGPRPGDGIAAASPENRDSRDAALADIQLKGSDYLYDYVVVGLLDVLADLDVLPA